MKANFLSFNVSWCHPDLEITWNNVLFPGCYNSFLRLHPGRSKKVAQHNAVADHERTNVILWNNPTGKDSEQVDRLHQLLTFNCILQVLKRRWCVRCGHSKQSARSSWNNAQCSWHNHSHRLCDAHLLGCGHTYRHCLLLPAEVLCSHSSTSEEDGVHHQVSNLHPLLRNDHGRTHDKGIQ